MKKGPRIFLPILVVALVLAAAAAAFAAWPSFQNDDTNNGVITNGTPPISQPSTMATVGLLTNNPVGSVFTGVDAAPVIKDGLVYAVHNGGVYDAATDFGGARLAVTRLATGCVCSVLLDGKASNVSQLSTPYVATIGGDDVVFVGSSYETEVEDVTSFTGWTASGGASIGGGIATFASTGEIEGSVTLDADSKTLSVQTNLKATVTDGATYEITLSDGVNPPIELVPAGTAISTGNFGNFYTYNGAQIDDKAYTATIAVTITDGTVTGSTFYLGGYRWQLNVVTDGDSCSPTAAIAKDNQNHDIVGEGQFNTPISYDANHIYFGIWGGDRSYYQVTKSSGAVAVFDANDNFYGAGAYSDGTYVYFGSDSGTIYKQPAATFPTTDSTLALSSTKGDAGQVRSTVVANGGHLYFTSKGTGSHGYLWKVNSSTLTPTTPVTLSGNSTSTPVISDNDYIYVGWYGYDPVTFASEGGVNAVSVGSFSGSPIAIYTGDPVQSSPIVWSDEDDNNLYDYVYFTTNSSSGAGYCYKVTIPKARRSTPVPTQAWTHANACPNPYSVQGMASEDGYVVWGDDANYLYIGH